MIWLLACASSECDDDACWHERIQSTPDLEVVEAALPRIEDPIVKSAALMGWIQRNEGDRDRVLALCEQLSGVDATMCSRRLDAAHLR